MKFSIVLIFTLLLSITNCGGQNVPRLPVDGSNPPPRTIPTPTPTPVPPTLTAAQVFVNIPQTWEFVAWLYPKDYNVIKFRRKD
jgi:hypothetical protein